MHEVEVHVFISLNHQNLSDVTNSYNSIAIQIKDIALLIVMKLICSTY